MQKLVFTEMITFPAFLLCCSYLGKYSQQEFVATAVGHEIVSLFQFAGAFSSPNPFLSTCHKFFPENRRPASEGLPNFTDQLELHLLQEI